MSLRSTFAKHAHLLVHILLYDINHNFPGSSLAEGLFQEEQSEVMPTGRVVGVLQRNWRDYVASFAENEVHLLCIIKLFLCLF